MELTDDELLLLSNAAERLEDEIAKEINNQMKKGR
nr:MAG TPA: hypothetical protein [Caudoviricetes sp.]